MVSASHPLLRIDAALLERLLHGVAQNGMLAGAEVEHAVQHTRDGENVLDGLGLPIRVERGHQRIEGQALPAHIVDLQPDGLHESALRIVVLEIEDADRQAHPGHAVDQHVQRLRFAGAGSPVTSTPLFSSAAVLSNGAQNTSPPALPAPSMTAGADGRNGAGALTGSAAGAAGCGARRMRSVCSVQFDGPLRYWWRPTPAEPGRGRMKGRGTPPRASATALRQEARHIRLDGVMQAPRRRIVPFRLNEDRRRGPEGERLFDARLRDADRDKARREHMGA